MCDGVAAESGGGPSAAFPVQGASQMLRLQYGRVERMEATGRRAAASRPVRANRWAEAVIEGMDYYKIHAGNSHVFGQSLWSFSTHANLVSSLSFSFLLKPHYGAMTRFGSTWEQSMRPDRSCTDSLGTSLPMRGWH